MQTPSIHLAQQLGRHLTLGCCDQHDGIVYRYEPQLPKPAIHPLVTPAGVTISGFEMSDHIWHRGLWFAIKFVNQVNFWEERAPFGTQVTQGEPLVELAADAAAAVRHQLEWRNDDATVPLREKRTLVYLQRDNHRQLDWHTELTAATDLTLDRTPFTTWGGYGGLAFRGSRELHDVKFHLPQGEPVVALTGQPHPWCLMDARVDGGRDRKIWIGMIDHPENPRTPSPWYCKCANGFTYMNPAFLFAEPMSLQKDQTLSVRYRVLWGDGPADPAAFAALARAYNPQ